MLVVLADGAARILTQCISVTQPWIHVFFAWCNSEMWVDGLLTVMKRDFDEAVAVELDDDPVEIRFSGNSRNARLIPVFGSHRASSRAWEASVDAEN